MKISPLIPAFVLVISSVSRAEDAVREQVREIERKIAELENEKAKLTGQLDVAAIGVFDAEGNVNPRITNAVLIIEGDKSLGTGFVATTGGKNYVYTAAHVFSGNSKLTIRNASGTVFRRFGDLETADGADLVRMEILDPVTDALEFRAAEPPLQINTKVAALGNGAGSGVVALEKGAVLGTSEGTLEVDAGVIQGNSGGPVLEISSGKVVGLVTHGTPGRKDSWSEGTRQANVRRFACRLDRDWAWEPMKITRFLADAKAIDDYDELTRLCNALRLGMPAISGNQVISIGASDPAVNQTLRENPDNDLIKSLAALNEGLMSKKNAPGFSESKGKIRSVLASAQTQAIESKDSLKTQDFSWFHRNRAKVSLKNRRECIALLDQALERVR